MQNKIKVGMLIARFDPEQGGAEIQCKRLSIYLKSIGYDISVYTQSLPGLTQKTLINGIEVNRIGLPIRGMIGSLSYLFWGFLNFLKKKNRCDIFHAHITSTPAILAGLMSYIFKVPSILKIAGSRLTGDIATSLRTWYGRIKLKFLKYTITKYICPSKEIAQELIDNGFESNKILIIPNGVDIKHFKPSNLEEKIYLRYKLNLPEKIPLIISIVRFVKGKGIETLIDAWNILNNENNINSHLIILGKGEYFDFFKEKTNLLNNITIAGWKENTNEYLSASDIFVLPSFGEGLPNALLEAMACGLACIATNIGGVKDIISDKINGILVEPGNLQEIINAIKILLEDPILRSKLGEKARLFIENNLSLENITKQYDNLYKELIGNN